MARITCRTPSTGKPLRIASADVPITFITIAEAPDFSIPDTSEKYADRDPLDDTRAIRPGEQFFLTPISAKNKDSVDRWVEAQLLTEDGIVIEFGRILIPAGDTAFIPTQGRSLFKRDPLAANGDRFQIRAETANTVDVWAAGEEKLSSEHTGVV
mgnify:CR=1 FL=1|tara:strand:+ start:1264 stop:1728 length:465 start_codon:yes stop_codon:yes gene_type:complete